MFSNLLYGVKHNMILYGIGETFFKKYKIYKLAETTAIQKVGDVRAPQSPSDLSSWKCIILFETTQVFCSMICVKLSNSCEY